MEMEPFQRENGKYGYRNKETGEVVVECRYDKAYVFESPLAIVEIGGKRGLIDLSGREAAPCVYDLIYNFTDCGLAKVVRDGKTGYIDSTGRECVPCEYDFLDDFNDGVALAAREGQMFFIDTEGRKTNGI